MTVREDGGRPEKNSLGNLTSFQETLEQGGISDNTAHVWQKVARVPEDKFEIYFTEADYYKDEFTIAGLLKFAGKGRIKPDGSRRKLVRIVLVRS
ncbi:MAG: hypothetical protein ABSH06_05075 [Thermodesulfobacteriota bacterium]|jgi:hypothetical protein